MKKILVTGGAGFIGTSLIKKLIKDDKLADITSLDNYFTGKVENHIKGVEYIKGNTWDADTIFKDREFNIVYHFGEYSRIVKSFRDINFVQRSILSGTPIMLELCKKWNAKLIYSASSSKFGNNGQDENLSPYAWMKAKMVELIKNYSNWYDLKYEICYFFNVYGPGQITSGDYATVIGIFEKQYNEGKKYTVVSPGTQTRDFTHIDDIISGLIKVSERDNNGEWHLRSGINISIVDIAKMFGGEWELKPERRGERFTSEEFPSDTETKLNWKAKINLEDYVNKIKTKKNKTI